MNPSFLLPLVGASAFFGLLAGCLLCRHLVVRAVEERAAAWDLVALWRRRAALLLMDQGLRAELQREVETAEASEDEVGAWRPRDPDAWKAGR